MYDLGKKFASKHKFKILETPSNTISIALHLDSTGIENEDIT